MATECTYRNCDEAPEPGRARCLTHLAMDARHQAARRKRLGLSEPSCGICGSGEHYSGGCPDRGTREAAPSSPRRLSVVEDPWPDLPEDVLPPRPLTRGDCEDGPRPCPFVSCRHHLLGLGDRGVIGPRSVALAGDPDEIADRALALTQTCALDVADKGQHDLESIGDLMGLTRERIRQIEEKATAKMRRASALAEHAAGEEEPVTAQPAPPRRQQGQRLTEEERAGRHAAVLAAHAEGLTHERIAERVGIAPSVVSRTLRAEGIRKQRKGPAPHPQRDAVISLIEQGLGNKEICTRLGVLPASVTAWRAKHRRAAATIEHEEPRMPEAALTPPESAPAADAEPAEMPPPRSDLLHAVGARGKRGPAPSPKRDEALVLMAQGLRDAAIADRLGINRRVVSSWRTRARRVLQGEVDGPERVPGDAAGSGPDAGPTVSGGADCGSEAGTGSEDELAPAAPNGEGGAPGPALTCGYRGTCPSPRQEGSEWCEYHTSLEQISESAKRRSKRQQEHHAKLRALRAEQLQAESAPRGLPARVAELERALEYVRGCLAGAESGPAAAARARIEQVLGG